MTHRELHEKAQGPSISLGMRKTIGSVLLVILFFGALGAQESATPSATAIATPAPRSIRISFVPPPLDGTISLGIFDAKGKLVRVLFREADINEFTIGNDALSTSWDGKDDAGENAQPGKYSAHGFIVGDLKIEGVGFFFNDWVSSAEGPRFSRIQSLSLHDKDLILGVDLVPTGQGHVLYDLTDKTIKLKDTDRDTTKLTTPFSTASGNLDAPATAPGRDASRWVIDRTDKAAGTIEVKQFSANGEFLRRFPISPSEPQPRAIAASTTEDKIYLLEEDPSRQRIRALTLASTRSDGAEHAVSEWKVDFEKSIVTHKDFSVVDGKPVAAAAPGAPPEKAKLKLQANPLLNDDRVIVEMMAGFDADGSFLKTADGLPLCTISETQELRRALLYLNASSALDFFQDDGAVVEQFRITGVDQMMSFDCGGFELK